MMIKSEFRYIAVCADYIEKYVFVSKTQVKVCICVCECVYVGVSVCMWV